MNSTKHGNNDITSEENDKKEKIKENSGGSTTTRSYDCAFCKRGFTNAQALGGHMNIHRKDKAKAKKLSEASVAQRAYNYFAPISIEQAHFYDALRANESYQVCTSPPNPSFAHTYYPQTVSNTDLFTPYGEFMGTNLSLRIGLPTMESTEEIKIEDHEDRNWLGNDQVDLELRLGQNP